MPRAANGNVVETGVWIASELINFTSYGIAPGALRHEKRGVKRLQLVPVRLKMSSVPMPTGGLAVLRVRLLTLSGAAKPRVLQVSCALGDVPRERSLEGIRLSLESDRKEFSEELGGRVMFLRCDQMPVQLLKRQKAAEGPTLPKKRPIEIDGT